MRGFNKDALVNESLARLGSENRKQLSATFEAIRSRFPNADIYVSRMTEQGDSRLTIGIKDVDSTKGRRRVLVISPSVEKFSPDAELFLVIASGSRVRSVYVGHIHGIDKYRRERNKGTSYSIPLSRHSELVQILDKMKSIELIRDHMEGSRLTPDSYQDAGLDQALEKEQREIEGIAANTTFSVTERETLIKARIGEGYFRDLLMVRWKGKCAITSCTQKNLLRASHIRPWADCEEGRLCADNGILLSVTYDALFDQHLITFTNDGKMLLSHSLKQETIKALHIQADARITFTPGQQAYLEHHRKAFKRIEAGLS